MTTNAAPGPMRKAPSASCEDTLEQTFGKPGPGSYKTAESPKLDRVRESVLMPLTGVDLHAS